MELPALSVVPYKVKTDRPARRGHDAIPAGTTVYLIQANVTPPLYFAFCYLNEADTTKVIANLQSGWHPSADRLQWNFHSDPEECLHTAKLYLPKSYTEPPK